MIRSYCSSLILVVVFLCIMLPMAPLWAQEGTSLQAADSLSDQKLKEKAEVEKFNPGEMIMEHVVDNHEWHIASIGHTDIYIPLPVLLICDGRFHAFLSSRFHNETHS